MKKIIRTLALVSAISIQTTTFSQIRGDVFFKGNNVQSYFFIDYEVNNFDKEKVVLKENKVKSRTVTDLGSKNTITETFNKEGKIISYSSKYQEIKYEYLHDTIILSKTNIYKKDTSRLVYEYDVNNAMKAFRRYLNSKLNSELIITKNAAGKVTSRLSRYGKNLKNSSETKYYYDDKNVLLKSESYFNNQLKKVWNYDCNPAGELNQDKEVVEKNICKWTETASNGSYIQFNRTTEKEQTYLSKFYYTKDSVQYMYERFLNDTILVQMNETKNFQRVYKSYSDKGKIRNEQRQVEDNGLLLNELNIYFRKNKSSVHETIYTYNSHKLVTSMIRYNNNKKGLHYKYEYTFNL